MHVPYLFKEPFELKPLIISVPHCGTEIPEAIRAKMNPTLTKTLPDTDWFVHELYAFGPMIGATLLHAHFSRYVVDLNRPRHGGKLYHDGRQESGLIPTHSFQGEALYAQGEPTDEEKEQRLQQYYDPYHTVLAERIDFLKQRFKHVLLLEAHSIMRFVPRLYPNPLPDLMLGSADGQSADPKLVDVAHKALTHEGRYTVNLNHPFKGGFITRHYGRPQDGIHALQLEMAQDIYMAPDGSLDKNKAGYLIGTLESYVSNLLAHLEAMP